MACSFIPCTETISCLSALLNPGKFTSHGYFLLGRCHCSISQYTAPPANTSTLWLYLGCGCHSSGACQLTVPTRLRTMERVLCFTLAKPKSAILATPFDVMRIFDDLQSRWMTEGFR